VTVRAPGGKLITIWEDHIRIASANKKGAARKAAGLRRTKMLDLMLKRSSIVETFIVSIRSSLQRYWTNAIASPPLNANPKILAKIFDIVETYVCGRA
jgi:hypothetical protein